MYAERRTAGELPKDIAFTTKPMLGWAMIDAVVQNGRSRCHRVTGDEAFRSATKRLDKIASLRLCFLAEVPHDTRVWRERPATALTPWTSRGAKPKRERLAPDTPALQTVVELAAEMLVDQRSRQVIQEGSQEPQVAEFTFLCIIAVRNRPAGPGVWLVLIRSLMDGDLKTYLCSASADIPRQQLVRASGMCWPVESCFETGKQELEMGDYEVRRWRGWHHHMTLVFLAMTLLVRLQSRLKKRAGLNDAASVVSCGPRYSAAYVLETIDKVELSTSDILVASLTAADQ